MKERTCKFLRVIFAIAAAIIGVLIWKEIISLPLGLIGLFAAVIYYSIDFFLISKKREDKSGITVTQNGNNPISVVGNVEGGVGNTTNKNIYHVSEDKKKMTKQVR